MVRRGGENDRIAKRVYVEECTGSCPVGRLQKREGVIKKRGLDVRQARKNGTG